MRKLTTVEEWIEKARKVHGDIYGYEKVEYAGSFSKVRIYCKKCGKYFEQTASLHLQGHGCKDCGNKKTRTALIPNTKEWVEKARKVHGDLYGYEKVEYINSYTKVKIYCKKCKKYFTQAPSNHLYGQGCPDCGIEKRAKVLSSNTQEFIEKAKKVHGDLYSYGKVEYINSYTKVKIFCKKCGKYFSQRPNDHLKGCGCSNCKKKRVNISVSA